MCSQGAGEGTPAGPISSFSEILHNAGKKGSSHFCKDYKNVALGHQQLTLPTMSETLPHDKANTQKQGQEMEQMLSVNDVI